MAYYTFTDKEVGSSLTDEIFVEDPYDLYNIDDTINETTQFGVFQIYTNDTNKSLCKNKFCLVIEHKIVFRAVRILNGHFLR